MNAALTDLEKYMNEGDDVDYAKFRIIHRHSGNLPYHYQKREKSLRSAVRYIRKHDRFQMNGRKW